MAIGNSPLVGKGYPLLSEEEARRLFAARLTYWIARYKMTQEDAGLSLGLATMTLQSYLNRRSSPKWHKLLDICNAFGLSVDEFFDVRPGFTYRQSFQANCQ